ncbi:hypothetical protein BC834DRAFT_625996 [Gloeopeniophorella convolvens]|nr:hypothetical protein BC834DRAFT_625996 [Gloeopeniophorella convolvens]
MDPYRRWVRDEDVDRLPHGIVRTGYDADTQQCSFRDTATGVPYVSAPGNTYGTLVPAASAPKPIRGAGRALRLPAYHRPVLFADDAARTPASDSSDSASSAPSSPRSSSPREQPHKREHKPRSATFADILPPALITAAPPPATATSPPVRAARRTRAGRPRARRRHRHCLTRAARCARPPARLGAPSRRCGGTARKMTGVGAGTRGMSLWGREGPLGAHYPGDGTRPSNRRGE